jgi:hypothetical protein
MSGVRRAVSGVQTLTGGVPARDRPETSRGIQASRLALAAVLSVRAVLVYGEAASAASTELTWRDLLLARRRPVRAPRPRPALASGGPAPARVVGGPTM